MKSSMRSSGGYFSRTTYEGQDIGAVTIFQGDLRISTSLTLKDGSRAVGTRLQRRRLR